MPGPLTPPSTRGIARVRDSPGEWPWHFLSLREGTTELGSAQGSLLCCRWTLGSLGSSVFTAQWEAHHNPLTV